MKTRKRKKYNTKLEIILLTILLTAGIITVIKANTSNPPRTSHIVNVSIPTNSDEYIVFYNEFWQKFNTRAAIMGDANQDSMVSQTEIALYKSKFLGSFNMKLHTDGIFVLDDLNNIVSPDRLMCLLNLYNAKSNDQSKAIDKCAQ